MKILGELIAVASSIWVLSLLFQFSAKTGMIIMIPFALLIIGLGLFPERTAPAPVAKEETKNCPACAEEILLAAKKCKHCGEYLEVSETEE